MSYFLRILTSTIDDPANWENGIVEMKQFKIEGIDPIPEPAGNFRRNFDGSGESPKQRRVIYEVGFAPFKNQYIYNHVNGNPGDFNFREDLTKLESLLTSNFIVLAETDYLPVYNIYPGGQPETPGFANTHGQYQLPRIVTFTGDISRSRNIDEGSVELMLKFEEKYPRYLSGNPAYELYTNHDIDLGLYYV